jgi:hypothetical protein
MLKDQVKIDLHNHADIIKDHYNRLVAVHGL